jgi:plasmid stabilization system protein ParE
LSETLEIEVTPLAAMQIEAAATWWAQNRRAAPDAIRVDFHEATALLSRQPGVGAKSITSRYPDLRRLYLSRVRYHVYYRVRPGKVVIVGFWHASRGTKPQHLT